MPEWLNWTEYNCLQFTPKMKSSSIPFTKLCSFQYQVRERASPSVDDFWASPLSQVSNRRGVVESMLWVKKKNYFQIGGQSENGFPQIPRNVSTVHHPPCPLPAFFCSVLTIWSPLTILSAFIGIVLLSLRPGLLSGSALLVSFFMVW